MKCQFPYYLFIFMLFRINVFLKYIFILKATANDFVSFCYNISFMLKLVLRESSMKSLRWDNMLTIV